MGNGAVRTDSKSRAKSSMQTSDLILRSRARTVIAKEANKVLDQKMAWWRLLRYALVYNLAIWAVVSLAWLTSAQLEVAGGLFGFMIGAAIGSFLNQLAYRLPRGMNLDVPPSSCPKCGTPICDIHNIPIISWFILRGRCYACSGSISWHYPAAELTTAFIVAILCIMLTHVGQ